MSSLELLEPAHMQETAPRRGAIMLVSNQLWYLLTFRRVTIERLLAAGFDIVCAGQGAGATGEAAAAELRALGCTVEPLHWRLETMNPVHECAVVARLYTLLRQHRPLVVFAFTIKANLNAGLAARLARIPYVANVSGLGTAFLRRGPHFWLVQRLFGFANAGAHTVFFQNNSDRQLFESMRLSTGRRTLVLPGSGVDVSHFEYAAPRPHIRTFALIARLIRDKGVIEYLEAARLLTHEHPDLRFILVGPCGVQNAGALSADDIAPYRDCIDYRGELADVRPVLREADCVVLPSYREGMPKVILESASTGRISLVSDAPGCRDAIVDGQTGFLFAPRSVDALAHAMRRATRLTSEDIQTMSNRARQRAVEDFHVDLSTTPYLNIAESFGAQSANPP